jgi:hypothetical protein
MNQVFDFKRWMLLVSKHWSENRKKYLLGMVAMAGLIILWYGLFLLITGGAPLNTELQANTYFVGLVVAGCFYGSTLFNDLASGPKAMNYLIFPASHLEKLLCELFYGVVLFFTVYTILFYIVNIPMVKLADNIAEGRWPVDVYPSSQILNVFSKPAPYVEQAPNTDFNPYFFILLIYIATQAAYILGSVYFSKYSFIKTTISILMVTLLLSLFVSKILYPILPEGDYEALTRFRVDNDEGEFRLVSLPEWIGEAVRLILTYALAPFFWVVTYFRIKEKQV